MHALLTEASTLSDAELLRRIEVLAGRERQATVELIAHLAELARRKLYRGEGYASLFSYCTRALRLAEQAAYKRIVAKRASRRFPVLLDKLASGSLNLSTLCLLAPLLTDANYRALLAEAAERSKREVEELVARISPKADVPASVRKLPAIATASEPPGAAGRAREPLAPFPAIAASQEPLGDPRSPASSLMFERAADRPVIAPLAPERYRFQFTVGHETQEKFRRVQDLLRREIPSGDPAAIFERALTLLLEDVARKKLALTTNTRPPRGCDLRSRHVPAEVKRRVWLRDGGRCAFVARSGRRCGERSFLEFHHKDAYALGGETTMDNLSLRCRSHNLHEAELVFEKQEPRLAN
jgi:hypothetical protein